MNHKIDKFCILLTGKVPPVLGVLITTPLGKDGWNDVNRSVIVIVSNVTKLKLDIFVGMP